jgi:hypothetical protein
LSHISARTALGDAKKVSENYTHIELTNQLTKQSSSMSKEWVPAVFLERSRKFAAALSFSLSLLQANVLENFLYALFNSVGGGSTHTGEKRGLDLWSFRRELNEFAPILPFILN